MTDEMKDVSKLRSTMLDLLEDNQRYVFENQRLRSALEEIDRKLEHNVSYPFKQNDESGVLRGLVDLFNYIKAALDGEGK